MLWTGFTGRSPCKRALVTVWGQTVREEGRERDGQIMSPDCMLTSVEVGREEESGGTQGYYFTALT